MTDQEKKEVLARFAGFTEIDLPMYCHDTANDGDGWYVRPITVRPYWSHGNYSYRELPDFLHSLDAQAKWLDPLLEYWALETGTDGISAYIIGPGAGLSSHKSAVAATGALAKAEAILSLIGEENED